MEAIYGVITRLLMRVMHVTLFLVGLVLCGAIVDSLVGLGQTAWRGLFQQGGFSDLIDELIIFFLYFEFLALIVKYFKNNYHFPLDFFLYIGITAVVRLLIVSHETALDTMVWAAAILILVISLVLVEKYTHKE